MWLNCIRFLSCTWYNAITNDMVYFRLRVGQKDADGALFVPKYMAGIRIYDIPGYCLQHRLMGFEIYTKTKCNNKHHDTGNADMEWNMVSSLCKRQYQTTANNIIYLIFVDARREMRPKRMHSWAFVWMKFAWILLVRYKALGGLTWKQPIFEYCSNDSMESFVLYHFICQVFSGKFIENFRWPVKIGNFEQGSFWSKPNEK